MMLGGNKILHRFLCNGIGIYEAVKQQIFKHHNTDEARLLWKRITDASRWLPKPPLEYGHGHMSWFTQLGKQKFEELVLPLMVKAADINVSEQSKAISYRDTVYHDIYQVVEKIPQTMRESIENSNEHHIDFSKIFNDTVEDFIRKFGIDLSYMRFKVNTQPQYKDGTPCYEYHPDECAGDWTKLGYIRLNPDMKSVMERYGLEWHQASDIDDFAKIIVAHELAHEVWNNAAISSSFKKQMLQKAKNRCFTTPYLKTVRPSKLDEEMFCEYLAHQIVPQIKEMQFPEDEIDSLSERKHIVTHRVLDDIDQFNEDDIVSTPWQTTYRISRKNLVTDINDSPYAEYLTQQQMNFLKDFDQIAILELDAIYEPPYTLQQIKAKYPLSVYNKLANDPVHRWRAEHGIELIHKEPTEEELDRIWANWQLMPRSMQQMSDSKSLELFGCTNAEHYMQLKNQSKKSIDEEEGISNNEVYLANMAKSFKDKAWFVKYLPKSISIVVDFGGGAGEFVEYIRSKLDSSTQYIVVDNNKSFASTARSKGIECFESLQQLRDAKGAQLQNALLVLSSVIHEIYSYADPFYDDVGTFWSDVKKCNFKCIAVRDMSYDEKAMKNAPIDAILWVYQNVLKSQSIEYKGIPFKDITDSFEDVWGAICDIKARKVDTKRLFHFLIKYRYQENWAREVQENYLPVSQEKLEKWLTSFMPYQFKHKESSHLEFYDKCWAKDLKLNRPDSNGYRRTFLDWLKTLSTHIKWLLQSNARKTIMNEENDNYLNQRTVFVHSIPAKKFGNILKASKTTNPHFSASQFENNYDDPALSWCMLFDEGKCVAAANLNEGYGPTPQYSYVNEIQCLMHGRSYGKKLLALLEKHYGKIWLCANPEVKNGVLENLYRDPMFGFKEYVIPANESIYKVDTHIFAVKGQIPDEEWMKFLKSQYCEHRQMNENKSAYLHKYRDEEDIDAVVDMFQAIRQRLSAPQNDIDWWIKKPFAELKSFVQAYDPSNKKERRESQCKQEAIDNGAELLDTRDGYEIWYVPSYEAMVQLGRFYKGRSAKWCVASDDPSFWFDMHDNDEFVLLIREKPIGDEFDKIALQMENHGRYYDEDSIIPWDLENNDQTFDRGVIDSSEELVHYAWQLFKSNGQVRDPYH